MTTQGSQVLHLLLITRCPLRYCSHDYLFKVEAQQRRAPIKVEMIAFVRFSPSRYIFSGKCYFALCVFFGLLDMILISTFVPMHLFHHHHHHQLLLHHKQHCHHNRHHDRQQCTISTRGRRTKEPTQTLKPRRSLSCSTSPCCFRFPFLHNNFKGIRCQSLIHCYCLSRRVQWVLVVPWRTSQVQDLKTSRPLRLDFGSTPLFQS